ncbi:MAG: leucyl/phenylalanyl-tRNA--protein transferase [Deltaproteobacteria bacterium]|nr:MAG: leucyl/phenylalanyl-tRNA--protein transferase [Deltaproteobacteria bacterium]
MQPPFPPLEPTPARVDLPDARRANRDGIVALSRTMTPGLVLQAYRKGIFPWPIAQGLVPWASPDPRAHFPLDGDDPWPRHVRRALKLSFRVTFDEAFAEVMQACAAERAEGTWITPDFAGESMFHRRTGASKVAFARMVERLRLRKFRLFDVQVMSPHLSTLGCVELSRDEYLRIVERCVRDSIPF